MIVRISAVMLEVHGLFCTTCAPAAWCRSRIHGISKACFINARIAELLDTVLWYCRLSYAVRVATIACFTCLNYLVHAIIYGYLAITATRCHRRVVPCAIYAML